MIINPWFDGGGGGGGVLVYGGMQVSALLLLALLAWIYLFSIVSFMSVMSMGCSFPSSVFFVFLYFILLF